MSERTKTGLRFIAVVLLAANALFFVYLQFAANEHAAERRIEQLQINPERIKIMGAATRGSGGAAAAEGSAVRACLQWGPLTSDNVSAAETALTELNLAQVPLQRRLQNERYAFLLREPDSGTIAKIAELQRNYPGTDLKAVPCPL